MTAGIGAGSAVVLHLASPREQVFGVVLSLSPSGVVVVGIGMASVDDWLGELPHALADEEQGFALSTTFYPMHRVEKVILDEPTCGAPAIHERFQGRVGSSLREYLAGRGLRIG